MLQEHEGLSHTKKLLSHLFETKIFLKRPDLPIQLAAAYFILHACQACNKNVIIKATDTISFLSYWSPQDFFSPRQAVVYSIRSATHTWNSEFHGASAVSNVPQKETRVYFSDVSMGLYCLEAWEPVYKQRMLKSPRALNRKYRNAPRRRRQGRVAV